MSVGFRNGVVKEFREGDTWLRWGGRLIGEVGMYGRDEEGVVAGGGRMGRQEGEGE